MRVKVGSHARHSARRSFGALIAIVALTASPVNAQKAPPQSTRVAPEPPAGPQTVARAIEGHAATIRGALEAAGEIIRKRAAGSKSRTAVRDPSATDPMALQIGSNLIVLHDDGGIRMLRGIDGSQVWAVARPGWRAAFDAGDLDGDGTHDLLLLEAVNGSGNGDGAVIHLRFDQLIEAISGATGERLWVRSEPLSADAAGPLLTAPFTVDIFVLRVQNLALPTVVDAETTHPSIFLDEFDWQNGRLNVDNIRTSVLSATERALLLDGADGTERARLETRTAGTLFPYTTPLGDLDGDDRSDLVVWELATYPAGVRPGVAAFQGVSAFSGEDGHKLWSANQFPQGSIAFDGPQGFDPSGALLLPLASGPTDDVLIAGVTHGFIGLTLLDGNTGQQRWRIGFGTDSFYQWSTSPGDIDGDGTDDVVELVDRSVCMPTGFVCGMASDVEFGAISGADGHALWTRAFAPADAAAVPSFIGDFDGDGVGDFLVPSLDAGQGSYRVQALRGSNGTTLWAKALPDLGLVPAPLGVDLNGDGGEDLSWIESREQYEVVVALSGATGSELWSAGEPKVYPAALGFGAVLDGAPRFVQQIALGPPDLDVYAAGGVRLWRA